MTRISRTIGAAAGGLLAAAFLPAAVAFADDPQYTLMPQDVETVTSFSGMPPLYQETLGTNLFGIGNTPFTGLVGEFNGQVDTLTTSWGFENQEIIVTGGQLGGVEVPTGSLFDYTNFGGGFGNEYSDIEGIVGTFDGPNTITDTFITPFGDFNIPTTFDAIALLDGPASFVIP